MRPSLVWLSCSAIATLLVGCSGDNFVPVAGVGAAGAAGAAGNGAGLSGGSGGGVAGNGGKAGTATGGASGASGGAAGEGGSTDGGAGGSDGGAGGSDAGAGGANAGAGGTDAGAGGANAGSGGGGGSNAGTGGAGGANAGAAGSSAGGGQAGSSNGGAAGSAGGGAAGAAGGGGAAGNGGAGGGPLEVCPILYVSNKGSGAASGCRASTPLGSLAAAFEAMGTYADAVEIHICEGDYNEVPLVVPRPVKITGSWNCTANPAKWSEIGGVTQYDPRTKLKVSGETGIQFDGNNHTQQLSTLERLRFVLNPSTAGKATAISLIGGASPTLRHLDVSFDAPVRAEGDAYGSAALFVDAGSAPYIDGNNFKSGPGSSTGPRSVGSVGVYVKSPISGFHFRNNAATGGKGLAGIVGVHGSAGMLLEAGELNVSIEDSDLMGGPGTGVLSGSIPALTTVGLVVRRASTSANATVSVLFTRSSASGGETSLCGENCQSRGLYLQRGGEDKPLALTIERSRLYGGDPQPDPPPGTVSRAYSDAFVAEGNSVQAVSSLFHGGGGVGGKTTYTRAVVLRNADFVGRYVTVLPGKHAGSPNPDESALTASATGFRLEGNGATKPLVKLTDSLIVASSRQTYGVYGVGGDLCGKGYGLTLRRVRHVHTESLVNPSTNQVGFFGASSGLCPEKRKLETSGPPIVTNHEIDLTDAEHVFGSLSDVASPFQLVGCAASDTCEGFLFDKLDAAKGPRAAVLNGGSDGYLPRCAAGAGIDTQALNEANVEDLRGLRRDDTVTPMLGALTRLSTKCP